MRYFIVSLWIWVMLIPSILFAQISDGTVMLGGQLHATASKEEKYLSAEITPQLGVFLNEHLSVGAGLDFGMTRYSETNKHLSLGILPTGRYFLGSQQAARPFIQMEAGYHRVNISVADLHIARSGLGGGVGAGLAYFVNNSVSMEAMYRLRAFKYTDSSTALHNKLSMGIQLYINPRRMGYGSF